MAWLAIEKGQEIIYDRDSTRTDGVYFSFINLPSGTIEKLTGKKTFREPIFIDSTLKNN